MNIVTIGSCLAGMTTTRILSRFGGEHLCHVIHHRSDQFYHYYIKKDKKKPPIEYVLTSLVTKESSKYDINYMPFETMVNNQYDEIGQHQVLTKYDFFDALYNKKIDIFILDNFMDMSGILSYPKLEEYYDSPILLRKNDFINYEDYFSFGEKIDIDSSIFYFEEIIKYLKLLQPTSAIFFINYPYNTYINSPERQTRGKKFEEKFQSQNATIIPAPHIKKQYQVVNDPAHFHDSIYVALSGFIYFHFKIFYKQKYLDKLLLDGKKFYGPKDYFPIEEISFDSDTSWTIAIRIYEFQNDGIYNFFLGLRGHKNISLLRRKNLLEFRSDTGSYISGVPFYLDTLNEIVVSYEKGNFIFYNNGQISQTIYHPTKAIFNAIGSGYDGKQHEETCVIFSVSFWNKNIEPNNFHQCFKKEFIEKNQDLIQHFSFDSNQTSIHLIEGP